MTYCSDIDMGFVERSSPNMDSEHAIVVVEVFVREEKETGE